MVISWKASRNMAETTPVSMTVCSSFSHELVWRGRAWIYSIVSGSKSEHCRPFRKRLRTTELLELTEACGVSESHCARRRLPTHPVHQLSVLRLFFLHLYLEVFQGLLISIGSLPMELCCVPLELCILLILPLHLLEFLIHLLLQLLDLLLVNSL